MLPLILKPDPRRIETRTREEELRGAWLDPEAPHLRYTLVRWWGVGEPDLARCVAWIGLNPSTADHEQDDPTMRRIRRFTQERVPGALGFVMLNLWAVRSPKPASIGQDRCRGIDVTGHNLGVLRAVLPHAQAVVAAWGAYPYSAEWRRERVNEVVRLARELGVPLLSLRGDNPIAQVVARRATPPHPLYRPASDVLGEWRACDA